MSITLQAPTIGQTFVGFSQTYTADSSGLLHNVAPQDKLPLLEAGCTEYITAVGTSSGTDPATPLTASATIPATGGSYDVRLTAAGTFQLTAPTVDGTVAKFKDAGQNWAAHNATFLPNAGWTIDGQAQFVGSDNGEEVGFRANFATSNWDVR